MSAPLVPAPLAFAADGTPFSEAFGDVYHSAEGGPGQARHVFLAGNGLPERWRGRRRFTVLETGFGLGLNFLVTWDAWRADAGCCERLHFVSLEKHPFTRHDLEQLHARHPEFAPLAAQLHSAWPLLVPGVHRLEFEGGRVVLTLAFADATHALRELRLAADAVFLDGFDPRRNPELWSPELMRGVARACAPGATAATWSAAAAVREALRSAGFEPQKHPGFAPKRDMLRARLVRGGREAAAPGERRALVVGAGIAGAAVSERLCARGWEVTLIERQPRRPADGPGRHAGVFHPVVTPDDSLFARLTRAGFLAALARWHALQSAGQALVWDACGVLQLARDEREEVAQRGAIATLALPPEYAQHASRNEASAYAGVPLAAGGLWFASSGWIRPLSLIDAQLAAAGARLDARFGCEAARIAHGPEGWTAFDRDGRAIARAPVVVLANAAEALRLAPQRAIRIRRVRGQISFLPRERFAAPQVVVLRGGFVLPALRGESIAGASYDFDDDDPSPRTSSHAGNLERLARILPGAAAAQLDPAALEGVVGFRAVAPDRLPLIGALCDEDAAAPGNPRLATLPRREGLYGSFAFGSRGLLWAGLGAELLASHLEGEPLPLEARLGDALDPGRYWLRALRRATSVPA
ncbi:MAG: bifunctional tRNA (5-methylaminomethyl-2-thiouridine)(34)-methyltransferase MnmD/FAD-dependent 5-carboxymethylaminomethyl-2-thiouridine(34) oxidoreductase MnmC [Betaproteobacteria bacterium]|nr:MAG: bifunctional tRNA (5-methylaminomethyl-2-thiouridine)(34)-methyltransferase MnmD/FAD-dependent 5-carboxymethylaminomethyl-2-thiouridine(34) oxidoreductase MnmC [Betaproteobacteria bacterium]